MGPLNLGEVAIRSADVLKSSQRDFSLSFAALRTMKGRSWCRRWSKFDLGLRVMK